MQTDVIIKRLALIKYLYKQGVEQSYHPDPIASFSILTFHDSIEMYLKLLAEHQNIKSDKFSFLEYWDRIETLTLKESCSSLNYKRKSIKHKGLLLSKADVEASRVTTTEFFEQNFPIQFSLSFSKISILSLIKYESVRNLLELSQKALEELDFSQSIKKSTLSFYELIRTYEISKKDYGKSPFFFGESLKFYSGYSMDIKDDQLSEFINKVRVSLEDINQAIKILSLGIDYRKFIRFNLLTPRVIYTTGGHEILSFNPKNKKWNKENCQFCIDFVVDSSMKLQDFDFSLSDLIEE